jgi:hypothetical protein
MAGSARHNVGCLSEEKYCWTRLESLVVYVITYNMEANMRVKEHTSRIDFAVRTLAQSASEILNADQGIFLVIQLSPWMTVIGPYNSSAVAMNNFTA